MSLLVYPNTSRTLLTPRLMFNPRQEEDRSRMKTAPVIFIAIFYFSKLETERDIEIEPDLTVLCRHKAKKGNTTDNGPTFYCFGCFIKRMLSIS